jgi:hypothetical protein
MEKTVCSSLIAHEVSNWLGGFYKRGCQVKTLYPSQGGFVFLGIQPLPAAPTAASIRVVGITTHFRINQAFVRS